MGFRVDVTIKGHGMWAEECVVNWASDADPLGVVSAVAQALERAGRDFEHGVDMGHDIVRIDVVPVS